MDKSRYHKLKKYGRRYALKRTPLSSWRATRLRQLLFRQHQRKALGLNVRVPLRKALPKSSHRRSSRRPSNPHFSFKRTTLPVHKIPPLQYSSRGNSSFRNGRGLAFPGYNYCGPFNTNFSLKPTNAVDTACRIHDLYYGHLSKRYGSFKTYTHGNQADQLLLGQLHRSKSLVGKLAKFYFKKKLQYTPHLN